MAVPVHAMPQGADIWHGDGSITQGDKTLVVEQNSGKLGIDWQSFSVAADERTIFRQPSADAVALNRVIGDDPSLIFGRLEANGRIYLVNPNGIVFGPNSRVDAAAFIASIYDIEKRDFLEGRLSFTLPGRPGAGIVNEGMITAAEGGLVALVAPTVRNDGLIAARLGKVILSAGGGVTIDLYGDDLIVFETDDAAARQLTDVTGRPLAAALEMGGKVEAGFVVLCAQTARGVVDNAISLDGIVRARSVREEGGRIILDGGTGRVDLAGTLDAGGDAAGGHVKIAAGELVATGDILASGDRGGHIEVRAESATFDGGATVRADGREGSGGVIEATAAAMRLERTEFTADGAQGGVIHVGGGWQGAGDLPWAGTVEVGRDALLSATGTSGRGGEVVFWSSDRTEFKGEVRAFGQGDQGGRIEISSKEAWRFDGTVNAGRGGLVLFDPKNITVVGYDGDEEGEGGLPFNYRPGDDVFITSDSVEKILRTGAELQLQANNDITVDWEIEARSDPAVGHVGGLYMQAGRSILVNADILSDGFIGLFANIGTEAGVVNQFREEGPAVIEMQNGVAIESSSWGVDIKLESGEGQTHSAAGAVTLGNVVVTGPQSWLTVDNHLGSIVTLPDTKLEADHIDLFAGAGIGTINDPLRTATGNLTARNQGTGDIVVANKGDLTLDRHSWGGEPWSVHNPVGSVRIDTSGDLQALGGRDWGEGFAAVDGVTAQGDIELIAGGDIIAGRDREMRFVDSEKGSVKLDAQGSVALGSFQNRYADVYARTPNARIDITAGNGDVTINEFSWVRVVANAEWVGTINVHAGRDVLIGSQSAQTELRAATVNMEAGGSVRVQNNALVQGVQTLDVRASGGDVIANQGGRFQGNYLKVDATGNVDVDSTVNRLTAKAGGDLTVRNTGNLTLVGASPAIDSGGVARIEVDGVLETTEDVELKAQRNIDIEALGILINHHVLMSVINPVFPGGHPRNGDWTRIFAWGEEPEALVVGRQGSVRYVAAGGDFAYAFQGLVLSALSMRIDGTVSSNAGLTVGGDGNLQLGGAVAPAGTMHFTQAFIDRLYARGLGFGAVSAHAASISVASPINVNLQAPGDPAPAGYAAGGVTLWGDTNVHVGADLTANRKLAVRAANGNITRNSTLKADSIDLDAPNGNINADVDTPGTLWVRGGQGATITGNAGRVVVAGDSAPITFNGRTLQPGTDSSGSPEEAKTQTHEAQTAQLERQEEVQADASVVTQKREESRDVIVVEDDIVTLSIVEMLDTLSGLGTITSGNLRDLKATLSAMDVDTILSNLEASGRPEALVTAQAIRQQVKEGVEVKQSQLRQALAQEGVTGAMSVALLAMLERARKETREELFTVALEQLRANPRLADALSVASFDGMQREESSIPDVVETADGIAVIEGVLPADFSILGE